MTPKSSTLKPPAHLAAATAAWWLSVVDEWHLEAHHVRLLTAAAESWDRAQAAREIVGREGVCVKDRFGQVKAHPACAIERDAKALFSRLIRELGLDPDAPPESRPSAITAISKRK